MERRRAPAWWLGPRPAGADGNRCASRPAPRYWLLGLPSAIVAGLIAGLDRADPACRSGLRRHPGARGRGRAAARPGRCPVLIVYLVIQVVEGNCAGAGRDARFRRHLARSWSSSACSSAAPSADIVGALIAIPVAAVVIVVLDQLQARDVPVTLDPTATTADDDELEADDPIDGSGRRPVVVPGR